MAPSAMIYDIQRFSLDDGPGIRTTFFLKGCNLRCAWCHNPEGISPQPQMLFYPEKCTLCGACLDACPSRAHIFAGGHRLDHGLCTGCGQCAKHCPAGALLAKGRRISCAALMREALKDQAFYRASHGGVTFSGGEPLLQAAFVLSALKRLRQKGIHTAIDTAGNVPWSVFAQALPLTDLVLFDLKALSPALHKRLTGATNQQIRDNLARVSREAKALFVRVPLVKGLNVTGPDDPNYGRMLAFLKGLPRVDRIDLLPYHRLGESKYAALGQPCPTGAGQQFAEEALKYMLGRAQALGLPAHCQAIGH